MPTLRVAPDLDMRYMVDDYTAPWTEPETILMLHGNAESGAAWYGWVPHLAGQFRVVRPDMRGYGASTPMPRDYPWTVDAIVDDYIRLMDTLAVPQFHVVGAKIGGLIAGALAARYPSRVRTVSAIGTQPPYLVADAAIEALIAELEQHGVGHWSRRTMAGRLGEKFSAEGVEWWIEFMGRTAASTMIGFLPAIHCLDIRADLPKIACPTLVITTEKNSNYPLEVTRAWQQLIPSSTLRVLPGSSFHVAASDPERCAHEVMEFISSVRPGEV